MVPGSIPNEFSAALCIKQPQEKAFLVPIFIQCTKHATPGPHTHNILFTAAASKGPGEKEGEIVWEAQSVLGLLVVTMSHQGGAEMPWTPLQLCSPGCWDLAVPSCPARPCKMPWTRCGAGGAEEQEVHGGQGSSVLLRAASVPSCSSLLHSQPSPIHLTWLKPNYHPREGVVQQQRCPLASGMEMER